MLIGAGIGIPFQQNVLARLLGSAEFFAPLTHSAIPTRAASGTTGTFTRATTSTWPNNDGYMVTGVAGEIGFVGARRVRNLLSFTEDFSSGSWTKSGVTASTNQLTEDGTLGVHRASQSLPSFASGNVGIFQIEMKQEGRRYVQLAFGNPPFGATSNAVFDLQTGTVFSTGAGATATIAAASGGYYLCTLKSNAASSTLASNIFINPSTDGSTISYTGTNGLVSISLRKAQVEDVTAQTTQTAGEYVSVGVESAPYYHGSFVDGVKCFPTDLSGNPIPAATMLGYQAEGARTNLCLQSNAFTTTWATVSVPTLSQNVIGPDGATSAWTITDNDAGASEGISQPILLTAAAYTNSIFVKKTVGAQTSYPVLYAYNGSTLIAPVTVDTTNGVATAWTAYTGLTIASGFSATCASFDADFWRVSFTYTGTATTWNHSIFPAGALTATKSSGTLDANATGSAVFYGAQVNLGSFAGSYIATTTAAVTRNADVLTYSSAGNIDGTKGWVYAELRMPTSTGGNAYVMDVGSNRPTMFIDSLGVDSLYDGTATRLFSTYTFGDQSKICNTWGGASSVGAVDGAVTTYGFDGDLNTGAAISIGCSNASASHVFGTIRNVRIGQRALSSAELQAITS